MHNANIELNPGKKKIYWWIIEYSNAIKNDLYT